MASSVPSPAAVNQHHRPTSSLLTATNHHVPLIRFFSSYSCSTARVISSHRSSLLPPRNSRLWRGRCYATSPRPPPPPESGPPPSGDQESSSGSIVSFSRFQESVQIFFAVLFWMSLFFWSSVWDGRNKGRSDKGPRFWK